MRPAKTQVSPAWSESSLSAWKKKKKKKKNNNLGSLATYLAHSKYFDQTGRIPRLIWVFAGRTCHLVFQCRAPAQIPTKYVFIQLLAVFKNLKEWYFGYKEI